MTKAITLVVGAMLLAGPATAGGIVCHDEYQVVNGQDIHTPYCADGYLAKVARERGLKVTGDQIRQQAGLKEKVCQGIGEDIRVQLECSQYLDREQGSD
jgi:hypothetical protein